MPNLGFISTLNINGNELNLKDAVLTEVVNEIIEAIGANNGDISDRINNLHERSFDALIKISSQNDSEIASIQDGIYKLHYVTVTGEDEQQAETLNNSAILIQQGTHQYLYKDGKISQRTKTNDVWGSWIEMTPQLKTVNNESLIGSGNIVISGLPTVTSADNGKILMAVNGQWQLVSPSVLYSGSGVPNNANGNNGDLYMQTD